MRPRRHVGASEPLFTAAAWRRLLRDGALIAAVFALGYLVSAIWISPAPLLGSADHAVPYTIGLPETEAVEQLKTVGFRPRISGTRPHPTAPAGTVLWQEPPADVVLTPNSVVTLVLSGGPASVPVPDVVGLDTATARHILTAAGVTVGDIAPITGGHDPGIVIATRPGIGAARPRGSAVGLVVSRGPAIRGRKESP